jgi:hypothetical protein
MVRCERAWGEREDLMLYLTRLVTSCQWYLASVSRRLAMLESHKAATGNSIRTVGAEHFYVEVLRLSSSDKLRMTGCGWAERCRQTFQVEIVIHRRSG